MMNSKKKLEFESSSLDSYSNFINKEINNFTTSSEISVIKLDNEIDDNNRTFIKEISTTIINAFTGKPISPNPWSKLCTKPVPDLVPIQLFSSNSTKVTPQQRSNDKKTPRSSRRDQIIIQQVNNEVEQSQSIEVKHQENTPLQHRRKKRNSLKDSIDNSSTSSDERLLDVPSKLHQSINNNSFSWHRLTDVYTSDSSDENKSNINSTNQLYSLDKSSSSISTDFNFLESLSDRIRFEDKHPDAQPYFLQSGFDLKAKRQELSNELFSIFNQNIFSSQLSNKVNVVWSGRLTATAGHCTSRKHTRTAIITLSHKVCDSPERCRDTLLHEMCHAAVTLIDGVMERGHGPLWREWTRKAAQCYPYLPAISIRHTYDVLYKFIYRCVQCEYEVYRHSKSLDLAVDYCGKCFGKFMLIINNDKDDVIDPQPQIPKKSINKYNLYVKENFNSIKKENPHLSTPQLMKRISEEYKKKNQQDIQLPDLDQLKI